MIDQSASRQTSLIRRLLIFQASRLIRFLPNFVNYPDQLVYLPAIIVYGYICQIMRCYGLLTISNVRDWLTIY